MKNMFPQSPTFLIFAILLLQPTFAVRAQVIKTVAGTGVVGYSGDGGQATAAKIYMPRGIVLDTAGNLFIDDDWNNTIRKVTPAGVISSIAGHGGASGFGGDGGPATAADMSGPSTVTLDKYGNVYIGDYYNHVVRKVNTTTGIITTVAGNGGTSFSGDGGPATAASFYYPWDLAFDTSGNMYIADAPNHTIRKVNPAGIISTFAGTGGVSGYSGDGGQATAAKLFGPLGVSTDRHGNVYISDNENNVIRRVNAAGIISTVAGNGGGIGFSGDGGQATAASLNYPMRVAADNYGNFFICDRDNQRIRKVNSSGIISTVAGNGINGFAGDGGAAISAEVSSPYAVAVDKLGNLYIADSYNNRVRRISMPSASSPVIVGINETISIFPNPNKGIFTVELESASNEIASLTVTNILGEKIKTVFIATNKSIDIRLDTTPGVYFITATGDHGMWSGKMVVSQ